MSSSVQHFRFPTTSKKEETMPKFAIVLFAIFSASANGLSLEDIVNAEKAAHIEIDEAHRIISANIFDPNFGKVVKSKQDFFIHGLWKEVRDFLQNVNIGKEVKDELTSAVDKVVSDTSQALVEFRGKIKWCSEGTNGIEYIIGCCKNIGADVSEFILNSFSSLNVKIKELTEAECKKSCVRPDPSVPILSIERTEL